MSNDSALRILLVGASGTLGQAVARELGQRHRIVTAGRNSGDVRIDLTDRADIERALAQVGSIDAVVSAAGHVHFGPLEDLSEREFAIGLNDKLMGQVNLALAARAHLVDGGSITVTTGVLAQEPIRHGSSASMVNGALEAFVMAAAIELPRGLRINAVSPGVLLESMPGYAPYFRGFEPVPAARAALGFSRSVEGRETGRVYRIA